MSIQQVFPPPGAKNKPVSPGQGQLSRKDLGCDVGEKDIPALSFIARMNASYCLILPAAALAANQQAVEAATGGAGKK